MSSPMAGNIVSNDVGDAVDNGTWTCGIQLVSYSRSSEHTHCDNLPACEIVTTILSEKKVEVT